VLPQEDLVGAIVRGIIPATQGLIDDSRSADHLAGVVDVHRFAGGVARKLSEKPAAARGVPEEGMLCGEKGVPRKGRADDLAEVVDGCGPSVGAAERAQVVHAGAAVPTK